MVVEDRHEVRSLNRGGGRAQRSGGYVYGEEKHQEICCRTSW